MPAVSNDQPAFHFEPERYPTTGGCFLIKDGAGRALLVGGTVNLRRRLAALFEEAARPPRTTRVRGRVDDRIPRLVAMARDIEVFLLPGNRYCPNLANSLIERYRPLFNLATYMEPSGASFISLTSEAFPRFTARSKETGAPSDCFGPFPSATRDLLIKSISESLGIRTCHPMPRRACISYQLKLCTAPCEGRVSREDYAWRVAQAARYLAAPGTGLIDMLEAQRQAASEAQDFEQAGRINARIQALTPAIAQLVDERSQRYEVDHEVHILYIAQGQAMRVYFQNGAPQYMEMREALGGPADFLLQSYRQGSPPELIVGGDPLADAPGLAAELSRSSGRPVTINQPANGPAFELLEIARLNHAYRNGNMARGHDWKNA